MKLKILEIIKEVKYYSIILNCTSNVSRTEHMPFIVRFVFVNLKNKGLNVKIHKIIKTFLNLKKNIFLYS